MPRLFLASFLPQQEKLSLQTVREKNADLDQVWLSKVRWVRETKLHLTWLFIGNVETAQIATIEKAVESSLADFGANFSAKTSGAETPTLVYDQVEIWIRKGLARPIVLTPSDQPAAFTALASKVRQDLLPFVTPDYAAQAGTPLRSHVTLLRLEKKRGEDAEKSSTDANETHPLKPDRRLKSKFLEASALKGLAEVMPIRHPLLDVDLVESRSEDGTHSYVSLRKFELPIG